jgi:flagellar hook-basal body complex protein FliE
MAYLDPAQALGDVVKLARTSPLHIPGQGEQVSSSSGIEQKFGDMLLSALGSVNSDQVTAMDLSQKMVTDPTSVNVEDVTIALAEANLSLSMTKAVVDRALAAYREIINVR